MQAFASLSLALAFMAHDVRAEWPQLQRDAQHTGYVAQAVVGPYTELWRLTRPFPVSSRVQPVIAGGLVFLPSNDGSLYAIKATDGSIAWKYATRGALVNGAAFDGGRIFFGSTDKHVYAVTAEGVLAWRYKTGGSVKAVPVIAGGKVYVGSTDGHFYAFDAASGALSWKHEVGAPIRDSAAVDAGRVFFGAIDSVGYALDAASGTLAWKTPIRGQGFRDRWTVAGQGKVFFVPVLHSHYHEALAAGTELFRSDAATVIYNQPWATQRQAILDHLEAKPWQQPLYVLNQSDGKEAFVAPVLYVSGGCQSPHSPPVLVPNGTANVLYRRSFGEPARWGATTNDAIYVGELSLTTGDIGPIDRCVAQDACGSFKGHFTSDESTALVRTGDVLYLDIARGTYGLDLTQQTMLPTIACYNDGSGGKFCEPGSVTFDDYIGQGTDNSGGGWRVSYSDLYAELNGDGNDLKRPTPVVGDTFYVLHASTLVAIKGVLR
jgi:hypothetical protein